MKPLLTGHVVAAAVLQDVGATAGTRFGLTGHESDGLPLLLSLFLSFGLLPSLCCGLFARLTFVECDVTDETPAELALLAGEDVAIVAREESAPGALCGRACVVLFVGFHEDLGGFVEVSTHVSAFEKRLESSQICTTDRW